MNQFTITLPVKPHMKKYLTHRYGSPIHISLDSNIGFIVLSALTSTLDSKLSSFYHLRGNKRFTQQVELKIPFHYLSICETELSCLQVSLINRYFEDRFEEELSSYASHQVATGIENKTAIEKFCQLHNVELDTDISSDAIIKMEYRFRKKNLQLISRILSGDGIHRNKPVLSA